MNLDPFLQTTFISFQNKLFQTIMASFSDSVDTTVNWWTSDDAKEFFQQSQFKLARFFSESGIEEQWSNIIRNRAGTGADIVEQIYKYAKELRNEGAVIPYTEAERTALNYLADSTYELIKNVTEDQIRGIREALVQDYAEGRNSTRTEILNKLEQIQLEPVNKFSPEQRARMIARTETSRAANVATLHYFKQNKIYYVKLKCNSDCDVCNSHVKDEEGKEIVYTVDEALEEPMFHPNCSCTWMAAPNPDTGLYQAIE